MVGPVLLAGGIALEGVSRTGHGPSVPTTEYLAFLAFLAGVLLVWYRSKVGSVERLKALELNQGRPAPPPPPPLVKLEPKSPIAAIVGAPVGVAGIGWMTCLTTRCDPTIVWAVIGLLGVTSLVCGTFLLARQNDHRRERPEARDELVGGHKPYQHDPDAFDVVARRG